MDNQMGRILCTEDDPDTRDMLVCILRAEGYEVVCPDDAIEALEMTKSGSFDLLLLDSRTPGLDGHSLTSEVRKFDQKTPILFYSGAALDEDLEKARDAGAQGYLTKPTDINELTDEITRLIAQAKESS
jgi:DNA-binding response OmpR family regulator